MTFTTRVWTAVHPIFQLAPMIAAGLGLFLSTTNGQNPEPDTPEPAPAETAVDSDLASPQATLTTFLKGIEAAQGSDDSVQWERVYKTLMIPKSAGESRRDAAVRLLQILKGIGELDPAIVAPDAARARSERLERFELFPDNPYPEAVALFSSALAESGDPPGRIVLANDEEAGWRFNAETVAAITPLYAWIEDRLAPEVAAEVEAPVMDAIRGRMPRWMRRGIFLGMELWQWLGVCLSLLLSVGVFWGVTLLLTRLLTVLDRLKLKTDVRNSIQSAFRPVPIIIAALAFILFLKPLGIIGTALSTLLLAARLVLAAGITWGAWSLTNLVTSFWDRHSETTETTFDDMLVPLVRKTLKLIIILWAVIYIAASIDILNYVTPILAGFGLAGLAISFAAQDIVRNVFGGLTIFLDRPFQVGERIILEGHDGVVETIGFRSTRLRTEDGHLVSIPNGAITTHSVENIGRRHAIRREIDIGLTYDTSPSKIREALETIRAIVKEPGIRDPIDPPDAIVPTPPHVHLVELGESALVIRVVYWFGEPDFWAATAHREKLLLRLLEELENLGVALAFPTRTVHLANQSTNGDRSDSLISPKSGS